MTTNTKPARDKRLEEEDKPDPLKPSFFVVVDLQPLAP